MFKKEDGYDEYLEEQIELGLKDIEEKRTVPLKDAKKHWEALLENKAKELSDFEREVVYG